MGIILWVGVVTPSTAKGSENLKLMFVNLLLAVIPLLCELSTTVERLFVVSEEIDFEFNADLAVGDTEYANDFVVVEPAADDAVTVGVVPETDEKCISNLGTDCINGNAIVGKLIQGGGASSCISLDAADDRRVFDTLFLILFVCFCCCCCWSV